MRSLVTLVIAMAATVGACKSDKNDAPSAPPSAPLSLPATEARTPVVAEATATLVAVLTPIAEKAPIAFIDGCREGIDKFAALFEKTNEDARELRRWLADETVRARLAAVVRDRSDPALANVIARLEAAAASCKAENEVKKHLDKLVSPAP